jgi:hypothetical protein
VLGPSLRGKRFNGWISAVRDMVVEDEMLVGDGHWRWCPATGSRYLEKEYTSYKMVGAKPNKDRPWGAWSLRCVHSCRTFCFLIQIGP